MKSLISIIFTLTLMAHAWSQRTDTGTKVLPSKNMEATPSPNSGPTDARFSDEMGATDDTPTTSPSQSSPSTEVQRQEEKKDDFDVGPYDKDGNYRLKLKEKDSDLPNE